MESGFQSVYYISIPVSFVAFGLPTGSGSGSVISTTSVVMFNPLDNSPVCDFSTTSDVICCSSKKIEGFDTVIESLVPKQGRI